MDFLHAVFEDELELQLNDNGDVIIGETLFSPVAILRADSAAYEEEFSKWISDRWLPEQNDRLERILSVRGNRKRFIDICSTLNNGQLIPLVGSGMSIPSGLSSWPDFLRKIRQYSSMSENDFEELLSNYDYESAAECLSQAMPERLFDERIEHDLRIDDPEVICGAVKFLPELFDKLVLTTNLDDLLEKLYETRKLRFSHVLAGNSISDYRKVKGTSGRLLLKFHGDCRSRNGRVLGKTEYERAYCNESPIRDELTAIYHNHSVLCLGCSLGPDRTVELLADTAEIDPNMPKHYAFLQLPKDEKVILEREHFLTKRDIFPIWYPDDHDESYQALFVGMLQHMGRL